MTTRQPTPETDALFMVLPRGLRAALAKMMEHAQKLERERDALKAALPEARQSAATPGAYRWIEKAVMLLKIAQQRALPMEDFWCELDTILAGVPVPPQDLGFNSPADLYARAWHALHSVRSPQLRSQEDKS